MECADDLFLEVLFARMRGDDGLAFAIRKVMVSDAEHVGLDTGGHQGHLGLFVLGYARGGMQRDGVPHDLDGRLVNPMLPQEFSRGIGAVHLEAFGRAAILFREAHIMKHSADVEQLGIKLQFLALARERAKVEDPRGMVVKQRGLGVSHQLPGGVGEFALWNLDAGDGFRVHAARHIRCRANLDDTL